MKKRRFDDPREICKVMGQLRRHKNSAHRVPYTAVMIIIVHILWKNYRLSKEKLSEYIQTMLDYNSKYDEKDITELQNRIFDTVGWKIECDKLELKDYEFTRTPFQTRFVEECCKYDNITNQSSIRYFSYAFNSLIDLGFTPRKITNIKDKANDIMNRHRTDENFNVMELWEELYYKAHIYIEKPSVED